MANAKEEEEEEKKWRRIIPHKTYRIEKMVKRYAGFINELRKAD